MKKILISDNVAQEALEAFKKYDGLQVDVNTGLSPDELEKIIGDYDGLIVRSATKVRKNILDKATNLKVIGRAGAGVDNIDVEEASKKGIIVMNTPGGNSSAVAELTIAMMLAISRNIVPASISMKEGKWEKKALAKTSVEVGGKTLGILGTGNIGSITANRAQGLKMKVVAYDPFLTKEKASIMGVTKVETLDEVFAVADYISLHLPKNEHTANMINKDTISKMKDGVCIINCARGGIVDENDLFDALNEGKVRAAALDVFEKEPVDPDHPLVKHPNVTCTPHLGASSVEAQINVAVAIANQIGVYLTTNEICNAINAPSLDASQRENIAPSIALAKKIGLLYSQFANKNVNRITIKFAGEVYKLPINPITTSLLIGLLKDSQDGVNFVNAQLLANEMGIEIIESSNPESHDYASTITMVAEHSGGTTTIKGAVFKEGMIRIVELDGFVLDFEPVGNMLLTLNNDVPGFIGEIGTVLGKAGINISNMELGRNPDLKKALSFIQIDGDISDDVLGKIKAISSLENVFKINLG